jgi:hypothetical protein
MTDPQTLQDLLAIEAIKQLKGKYFFLMDTKQWEDWRQLFTHDLRVEGTISAEGGRDYFVDSVRDLLEGVVSCHQGYTPIIKVDSDTTAHGTWPMRDDLRFGRRGQSHPLSGKYTRRLGYGYYDEKYRREDGEWKISHMRLHRLYVWSDPDIGVEMMNHLMPERIDSD